MTGSKEAGEKESVEDGWLENVSGGSNYTNISWISLKFPWVNLLLMMKLKQLVVMVQKRPVVVVDRSFQMNVNVMSQIDQQAIGDHLLFSVLSWIYMIVDI